MQGQVSNFFIVKKEGKYGVVSPKNKKIVPIIYDGIGQVSEDHFSARHEKNDKGLVNTFFNDAGRELVSCTENTLHF